MNFTKMAEMVDQAALHTIAIEQLSLQDKFSEKEAYAIQAASLAMRYERGERLIGLKMGFTSKAKMEQMGVHDMIWGRLTDAMHFENGSTIDFGKFIHPRAEPEICFLVKKLIDREIFAEDLSDHIEAVAPAIEVIDSRYENFKFSLEDVIADNCSSAGFVVGDWQSPALPLSSLKITLEIDGEVVQEGSSSAILGDPWESVLAASRLANHYGQEIPAGFYIMAGAATPAVYLEKGQKVKTEVEKMGIVEFGI